MKPFALVLFSLLVCFGFAQPVVGQEKVEFTVSELAFIQSHGPWPPKMEPDPSNRFSGEPSASAWGQQLFQDVRLSQAQTLSCASCHDPDRYFADGKARSTGTSTVDRNAIALADLRLNRWFGWAGQSDNLWAQSIHPILDRREMNATVETIVQRVRQESDLAANYTAIIGKGPKEEEPLRLLVNIAKILAAYQETIRTPTSAFDLMRTRLLEDEMISEDAAVLAGLKLFVGKGKCSLCHFGPNFTNGEFHDIGLPYFIESGQVDQGRYGGIRDLKASAFNRLGEYGDEPAESAAQAPTAFVSLQHRNWGEFRVPSLRNVSKTAPYMHNGTLASLEDVVRHYSTIDIERLHADGETILKSLDLTKQEIANLVAFLKTL